MRNYFKRNPWLAMFLVLVVSIVGLIFGPLAFVFSLNVLFKAGIVYSFESWAASVFFGLFCAGVIRNGRS